MRCCVIYSDATVRQTQENKMAKVESEGGDKSSYIFVEITLLRHVNHIIAHLNDFLQLLIDPKSITYQEVLLCRL